MRNIYDIISEQKSIVDITLASYEMNYLNESFNNKYFYVEEGLGETIKNIGRKVIEFIKKIIESIKEMIKAVINLFRKSKDPIKEMEDKMAEANMAAGGGGSAGGETNSSKDNKKENQKTSVDLKFEMDMKKHEAEVKERKERERKQREREEERQRKHEEFMRDLDQPFKTGAGVKIDSLQELLKNSLYKFSYYEMRGDIKERLGFLQELTNIFSMTYEHSQSILGRRGEKIMSLDLSYLVKKMNRGLFDDEEADFNKAIEDRLGDRSVQNGSGALQASTYSYADHIYEYIKEGRNFANMAEKLGTVSHNILKKIIRSLESEERMVNMKDDLSTKHFERLALIFQKFSNYMARTINYLVTSTMSEYKACVNIARTVTSQYCKSII